MKLLNYALELEEKMENFNREIENKYLKTCASLPCSYYYKRDIEKINKENDIFKIEPIDNTKKAYVIKHIPTGSILLYSYNQLVMTYIKTSELNFIDIGDYSPTTSTHQHLTRLKYDLKISYPKYIQNSYHKNGIKHYRNNVDFIDQIYDNNRLNRGTYNYTLTPVTKEGVIGSTEENQFIYFNSNTDTYYYMDMETLEEYHKPSDYKIPYKKIVDAHYQKYLTQYITPNMFYATINHLKYILGYILDENLLKEILNNLEDKSQSNIIPLLITYFDNDKINDWNWEDIKDRLGDNYWEVKNHVQLY